MADFNTVTGTDTATPGMAAVLFCTGRGFEMELERDAPFRRVVPPLSGLLFDRAIVQSA